MKIAIQGHPTRGKEVIQIFESLGTEVLPGQTGSFIDRVYLRDDSLSFNQLIISTDITFLKGHGYNVYTLEEFEEEFPFKVGDIVLVKGFNKPYEIIALEWFIDKLYYRLDNGFHYSPKTLTTYEKMKEERNITLTLEKAKEWYNKGGELKEIALQAYSEEELTKVELPKTWEEFCKNYPVRKGECWLDGQDKILNCDISDGDVYRRYKNWIPSKKSAEAHLALMQLEQLRDCWRQGWKPNWNDRIQTKYCIYRRLGKLEIITLCETSQFLSFPTEEMAEEFLECFRDLIEKAGDLI